MSTSSQLLIEHLLSSIECSLKGSFVRLRVPSKYFEKQKSLLSRQMPASIPILTPLPLNSQIQSKRNPIKPNSSYGKTDLDKENILPVSNHSMSSLDASMAKLNINEDIIKDSIKPRVKLKKDCEISTNSVTFLTPFESICQSTKVLFCDCLDTQKIVSGVFKERTSHISNMDQFLILSSSQPSTETSPQFLTPDSENICDFFDPQINMDLIESLEYVPLTVERFWNSFNSVDNDEDTEREEKISQCDFDATQANLDASATSNSFQSGIDSEWVEGDFEAVNEEDKENLWELFDALGL
ncbi:hypothetical protein HK096_007112 [Nowakowskiella sp. JEL0078]|nr:hypothetical protein HK096_007112 [Nowakowskiella sp. JEL0078]